MPIVLSSDELSVVLDALGVDPGTLHDAGDPGNPGDPTAGDKLSAARARLVQRGMADTNAGSLRIATHVRAIVLQSVEPQIGFDLRHCPVGEQPVRMRFYVGSASVMVHRIVGGTQHQFDSAVDLDVVRRTVLGIAGIPPGLPDAPFQPVGLPNLPMQPGHVPLTPGFDIVAQWAYPSLNRDDRDAIRAAGAQPAQKSFLSANSAGRRKIRPRGITWFADARSAWMFHNLDADGTVSLARASHARLAAAIELLVRDSL